MPLYCTQGHENQTGSRFCLNCGESLWLPSGKILENRYRILHQLGQGAFGRTYLAEDLHGFNERCVVKEFAPQIQGAQELKKAKELFEREAGALHQLNHPQVPRFREFFQADLGGGVGCLFLAQDYVEGQTYFDLLKSSKPLGEAEVTQFLCNLLPVLSYIHSQKVIHRDISPDNLILRQKDQMPVLIDFGGVKQLATTAVSKFTPVAIPTRLGKQGYAPPEQMRWGQVFPNSDLYALAVTALVLLTGKQPQELYDSSKATPLWGREIKVSPTLEKVLQKMLANQPGDRYQSAQEVLQALTSLPAPQNSNISQMNTVAVAPKGKPHPTPNHQQPATPVISNAPAKRVQQPAPSPVPLQPQNPDLSQIGTLVVAPGGKPSPNPNHQPAATHFIAQPALDLSWLKTPWVRLVVGSSLVVVTGIGVWGLLKPLIHSIPSIPVVEKPPITFPTTSPGSKETARIENIFQRRDALGMTPTSFNILVDRLFYAKHPELNKRQLTGGSDDAAFREEWYKIAEQLLDKLEKNEVTSGTRRK